ncbi:MAG: type II toxin-antitoxin system HicB family antitoxin [Gallionella sp.]
MLLPIAIHKDPNSVFGVIVPDIPGCHSWGDTMEMAVKNTKLAITSHVQTLIELGETVDIQPSRLEDLVAHTEYQGAYWLIVEVDEMTLDTKPERVNISLPRFLLHKIDAYTQGSHETRSGFLAKAAMKVLVSEQA